MTKSPNLAANSRPRPLRRRYYTKSRRVLKVTALPTPRFSQKLADAVASFRAQRRPKPRVSFLFLNRQYRFFFHQTPIFAKTTIFRSNLSLER